MFMDSDELLYVVDKVEENYAVLRDSAGRELYAYLYQFPELDTPGLRVRVPRRGDGAADWERLAVEGGDPAAGRAPENRASSNYTKQEGS